MLYFSYVNAKSEYLRYFHLDTYANILQRYTTRTLPAHTPAGRNMVTQVFTHLLLCQVN